MTQPIGIKLIILALLETHILSFKGSSRKIQGLNSLKQKRKSYSWCIICIISQIQWRLPVCSQRASSVAVLLESWRRKRKNVTCILSWRQWNPWIYQVISVKWFGTRPARHRNHCKPINIIKGRIGPLQGTDYTALMHVCVFGGAQHLLKNICDLVFTHLCVWTTSHSFVWLFRWAIIDLCNEHELSVQPCVISTLLASLSSGKDGKITDNSEQIWYWCWWYFKP